MDPRRIHVALPFRTRRAVVLAWCGLGAAMGGVTGMLSGEPVAGLALGLVLGACGGGYVANKRTCALRRASGVPAVARRGGAP
jgi:uncharacterized protein YcfJ